MIDPSQDLSAGRDVAILGHTIARVAAEIPEDEHGTSSTSAAWW